jgi:hypothetical protein
MMLERRALDMVRAYDVGEAGLDETLVLQPSFR